ncbi:MAG: phage tail protein I [Proteobacteria bacterium]|nr:phage tail protein I [Pseudomonadota bacterium]
MKLPDTLENDLLPPNATELEKELARRSSAISNLLVDISKLWDAKKIPEDFLPWLAWSMSLDSWQEDWDQNVKRQLVSESVSDHKQKGTRAAVEKAIRRILALADNKDRIDILDIQKYDASYEIREWWEQERSTDQSQENESEPDSGRYKSRQAPDFEILLLIGRGVLGGRGLLKPELYQKLRKAVDAVKPISTRYTLAVGGAELESPLRVQSSIRAVPYARFYMEVKPKLKFRNEQPWSGKLRSISSWSFLAKPTPKFQTESVLPIGHKTRAIKTNNLEFQFPVLKMKTTKPVGFKTRSPVYVKFVLDLQADSETKKDS